MKNKLFISALFLFVGLFSFAFLAKAESNNRAPMMRGPQFQQSINIEPNGHALVRGTLLSVVGTSLSVKSWGITFSVDTSRAQLNRMGTSTPTFVVGDFVDVSGRIATSTPGTIMAESVRGRYFEQKRPEDDQRIRMGSSTQDRQDNRAGDQGDEKGPQGNRGGMMNFFKGLFGR